ncbi:hypothetical protein QR680_012634 [Steinernema hermaphroditum]|uniref:Uncharacterized protein n=1 Tax=Steinernema hermaphroditum TaxID=289476 RepID=A0AA39I2M7_9BILA|nr:hypothetical protein QR680_012634 [Steinernema hermaphroditum]
MSKENVKDTIALENKMPPGEMMISKPSMRPHAISVNNDDGVKTMPDNRKMIYPPPLITAGPSKSIEKRGRGRPKGSKNTPKDTYRGKSSNGIQGDVQFIDPNAISLHDIGPAPSQEDGSRPSTSAVVQSTVRTKEFDYRRKVHERLTTMMQSDHSRVLCLLPEVESTTTSQMSIFIRRLRTQFWPDAAKKSSEIPTKPKMPASVAEPLYGTLCEDTDAFRKSKSVALPKTTTQVPESGKDWQFNPDLTESSSDSSGDEFTDDEVDKPPTKKRRFISRNCSDFKYYELKRQFLEAKDMLDHARIEKQRQLRQLKAVYETMKEKKEYFELEGDEESESARCRALKNRPKRDISQLIAVPKDDHQLIHDSEQNWYSGVGDRLGLPESCDPLSSQMSHYCRHAAVSVQSFEARRRTRKLVRAAMIAKKAGQVVPDDYMHLRRHEELWKTRKRVIKRRPRPRITPASLPQVVLQQKTEQEVSEDELPSEDSDDDYEEGFHIRKPKSGKSRGRPPKNGGGWNLNGVRRTSNAGKSKRQLLMVFKESEFEFDDQIMDTTIKQVDYKEIDVPTWNVIDMAAFANFPSKSCEKCTKKDQPMHMKLVAFHRHLELAEKRRCYGQKQQKNANKIAALREGRSTSGSPAPSESAPVEAPPPPAVEAPLDHSAAYEQCRSQVEGDYVPDYDRPSNATPPQS